MKYLDPVALARLRNIRLSFRRIAAAGPHAGGHRSRTRGRSQEFTEHREYVPGDELKFLDWKVYARKDRFFVREFFEERNLRTYLLVDGSGSMAFQGDKSRPSKWEYACRLADALAYLVLARSDSAGLMAFSDRQLVSLPPRSQMQTLSEIDLALERTAPQGPTRLPEVLRQFAPSVSRRSLLVVISDLMGPAEEIASVLRAMRSRKHELLVLQVLDPVERDLDYSGAVLFKDLEGERRLRCEVDELRQAYRREFQHMLRLYESSFRGAGIGYDVLYTDTAWDQALARFLAKQSRLL